MLLLGEEEALLLRCIESFTEELVEGKTGEVSKTKRGPGEEWLIHGPRKYVPPVQVQTLERRRKIPLDVTEGIYVRDKNTGEVTKITGQTYLLKAHEELWEKILSPQVERLLVHDYAGQAKGGKREAQKKRIKHQVVRYRVPHNAAVQVRRVCMLCAVYVIFVVYIALSNVYISVYVYGKSHSHAHTYTHIYI
jgi:major vault protein